jgi:two-component system sensor histidine kinase SenX3
VANVSHELKTPIGALALLAETMAAGEDSPVNTQLADRVQHEASRLAHIVDDLLDLSLIEAQEAPTREPVPVHAVLHEAAERVRGAAGAAGIPLSVPPVATDLAVSGDRSQLVSAVTNLLDNAVKYSERGESVDVDASAADGVICISVRDHGIGIPSRDLERIFERFYRVDRARSRATGGTGLGLSIVRHVAQAHGGDVTVESIEGEGSTFRLRLPLSSSSDRNLSEAS